MRIMCCSGDSSGRSCFELVLGEVTDLQALALDARSRHGRQFAGEELDQRRLAGAVAAEQGEALAGAQRQYDVGNDGAIAVAGTGAVGDQQRIWGEAGFAETEGERRIDVRRRDFLHACQRLDAALCLARLGGLGAEALDVAVQVFAFALLLTYIDCCRASCALRWRSKSL